MIYILIGFLSSVIWIGFEMWRAPMGEENENGYKELRPPKKIKDLFKKK